MNNSGCGELKTTKSGEDDLSDSFNINQLSNHQMKFSQTVKQSVLSHQKGKKNNMIPQGLHQHSSSEDELNNLIVNSNLAQGGIKSQTLQF